MLLENLSGNFWSLAWIFQNTLTKYAHKDCKLHWQWKLPWGSLSTHYPLHTPAYNLCLHCLVCVHGTFPNKLWASQYQIEWCSILAKSCTEPKLHSLFIYLFTQCQELFQMTHKDELILSSNNLIRQCLFLASSLDVTAELRNFTQLSRVRHFIGGIQAVRIQHLCHKLFIMVSE